MREKIRNEASRAIAREARGGVNESFEGLERGGALFSLRSSNGTSSLGGSVGGAATFGGKDSGAIWQ